MEAAKKLIDQIFTEKAKNDSNSQDLARSLDVLSQTVFGQVNRFIFELLQNADDAATKDHKQIDVQFRLLNNYIVFSHDGEHFNTGDVKGICSVASRKGNKDKAKEKTGYKGIGFKSVFGSSTYAHIISRNYSFRFDKNFHLWAGVPEEYPWQVIPIWTDEPAAEVKDSIDKSRVTTVIDVTEREVIKNVILAVFADCKILLFLRRVATITFFDGQNLVYRIEKSKCSYGIVELYKNDALYSTWRVDSYEVDIPKELTAELNNLSDTQCPQKLKVALKTSLTFAAQIKDGTLSPVSEGLIYSYLPTSQSVGFPFLVNGDFLLDASRTNLLEIIWNDFLFEKIAGLQLDWLLELQKVDTFRFDVLRLIKSKFVDDIRNYKSAFNDQLSIAAGKVSLLLDEEHHQYHPINRCIVDYTNFCNFFSAKKIRDFLQLPDDFAVVDYRYRSQDKISDLGGRIFGQEDLFRMIGEGAFKGWKESIRLSELLFFGVRTFNSASWDNYCLAAEFIADDNNVMRSAEEIHFPIPDDSVFPDISQAQLFFVHKKIMRYYEKSRDKELVNWLNSIGVNTPSAADIARKSILPMIDKHLITTENSLQLTRLLVSLHATQEFTASEYIRMMQLPLVTTQGLTAACKCYLSPYYRGDDEIADVFPDAHFVSPDYVQITGNELSDFQTFFKQIGCSTTLTVTIIEDRIERYDMECRFPESADFFTWLEETEVINKIYQAYRYSGQHSFERFTHVDFLDKLEEPKFANYFWSKALKNWNEFYTDLSNGTYHFRGGSVKSPSFLAYYARKNRVIPCTDGKCYAGSETFSPALKNMIGKELPVANFPASITAPQRDFFGLRKSLDIHECLILLEKIGKEPISPEIITQITAIYKYITGLGSENDIEIIEGIKEWKKNASLINVNNTFLNADSLWHFNVPGLKPGVNAPFFIRLEAALTADEKNVFCQLFSIPVITADAIEVVAVKARIDNDLSAILREKIPYFALISSKNSSDNLIEVIQQMMEIINNTSFYQAEKLTILCNENSNRMLSEMTSICLYKKNDGFYVVGEWRNIRTLFELVHPLCELLSISNCTNEIQLLLQLNHDDTKTWLLDNGYDISALDHIPQRRSLTQKFNSLPKKEKKQSNNSGTRLIKHDDFKPDTNLSRINFDHVKPVVRDYQYNPKHKERNYIRLDNKPVIKEIGHHAEFFVNNYLLHHPDSFTNVVWVNELEESGLPYDFICSENGLKLYIEVKGTPSDTKEEIYLSSAEWRFLFENDKNYSLFRIYGIGKEKYRFERINNVAQKIKQAELLPNPIAICV